MLRNWSAYYAAFPALGASILLALLAERLPRRTLILLSGIFLLMGFWYRTSKVDPGMTAEQNLVETGGALRTVEGNFHKVRASFPPGSTALVTIQRGGPAGVYTHLYYFQALRVWYRVPSIRTMRPDWRSGNGSDEYLFWVSPNLDVCEIDLRTMIPRSSGTHIDYSEYQKTIRYYARGLAANGEVERAVTLLFAMREPDPSNWALDRRLAVMLLFENDREADASLLARHLPRVYPDNALEIIATLLEDPPPRLDLDTSAVRAFDLSPNDPEVWRYLMHKFASMNRWADAVRFAERLLSLRRNDHDAQALLDRARLQPPPEPFWIPAPRGA